jgi:DNA-binding transcriptional MocR family regulator
MNLSVTDSPEKTLYEQVADRIRMLIAEGTLQVGDRLPSVRRLHKQLSVSISTVLEAYRLLEDQGLIEARPQSGYFVKRTVHRLEEPKHSTQPQQTAPIEVSLAFQVSHDMRHADRVNLGAAVPGIELLPIATLNRLMGQMIRVHADIVHTYQLSKGYEPLRHEAAKRLMEAGCSVSPSELVVTNGTTEALHLSLRAVTRPGETVAIESPSYYGLLEALESLHLKALEIPTHPKEGICLEDLEAALKEGKISACALVTNFSNPLGSCMGDRKKKQLVELLNRYDVPLIEDDIYGELQFEGARPKAVKAFDTEGRVLYCTSVSKTLSPGLRIGWAAAGRYQVKVEQLKMSLNWMTSVPAQLTVAAFLSNGGYDRHLRHLRRAYQAQMNRISQAICEYFPAETKVSRPEGGYVLWLEMPESFDAMAFYEEALQHNISIAPGIMFSPSGSYRNCFRLNCGIPWTEEIHQAIQKLGYLAKRQLAISILRDG